jgi:copper chaperone CopZ
MKSYQITGLTCGNCVAKVQNRLNAHPSITTATVTLIPPAARIQSTVPLSRDDLNRWLAPIGNYQIAAEKNPSLPAKNLTTYHPLIVILGYLILVTASVMIANRDWDTMLAMRLFMGGFFITFSFFKFLDLRRFSEAYQSYDIVAQVWPSYGMIYPWLELSLGLAYLANVQPQFVNLATVVVMSLSLVGVLRAVLSKQPIRCACLGTVFQLPMSTVTIIEDGLMLIMAVIMLLIS